MPRSLIVAFTLGFMLLTAVLVPACENDVFLKGAGLPASGVTTLFAKDPLRSTYDFDRADYGAVIQDGMVRIRGMHITYGTYEDGAFAVGKYGGETGVILDLGTDAEVAARIGAPQTVGGGQGFAGLSLTETTFNDATGNALFEQVGEGASRAKVNEGHVYVLRIDRSGAGTAGFVIKLLVVARQPSPAASGPARQRRRGPSPEARLFVMARARTLPRGRWTVEEQAREPLSASAWASWCHDHAYVACEIV